MPLVRLLASLRPVISIRNAELRPADQKCEVQSALRQRRAHSPDNQADFVVQDGSTGFHGPEVGFALLIRIKWPIFVDFEYSRPGTKREYRVYRALRFKFFGKTWHVFRDEEFIYI